MRRRNFLATLGAAALWPSHGYTQQAALRRLGYLTLSSNAEPYLTHFRQGLREFGLHEGKNIVVDVKSAATAKVLPDMVADLLRDKVAIIVTNQTPATRAAHAGTRDIPIVMAPAGDPVGAGFIKSLAQPGGNITGVSASGPEAAAKTLELMRELLPTLKRIAVLLDANNPYSKPFFEQINAAGKTMAIDVQPYSVKNNDELEAAFPALVKARSEAAIIVNTLGFPAVALAVKHRVAAIGTNSAFADAGCVLSYNADPRDLCYKAASYVDRIFRGQRPSDLPVALPTKFELVINHKVARSFGMTVPQTLLLRADKVID
jgi:putative ABC transport system substrate-binding protein